MWGPGWLWGRVCRKGAISLDSLPSAGGGGGREISAPQADALKGGWGEGSWSSGLGSPPPLLGSRKESSLTGSLAVSFTLNIKVKQKSQASVLAKERRAFSSTVWAWDLGPPGAGAALSHSPSLRALRQPGPAHRQHPTPRHRFCVARAGAPFAGPARAHVPIIPTQTAPLQSKQINATGRAKTPTPKSQTSSSCPILFSRLKNKIQTIREQRSQVALSSTRTKGLCTTIR